MGVGVAASGVEGGAKVGSMGSKANAIIGVLYGGAGVVVDGDDEVACAVEGYGGGEVDVLPAEAVDGQGIVLNGEGEVGGTDG